MGEIFKHPRLSAILFWPGFVLAGCATTPAADAPKLAITIDDLPVHGAIPAGMTAVDVNRQMIKAIQAARVPGVTVFANGHWTQSNPQTGPALQAWQDAGIPVANHTWSHKSLDAVSVDAYKEEIVRNEPVLERYSPGKDWRWFRYPFLHEGDDSTKRLEIRRFLAERNYRIASVSMDFGDWRFTAPYGRCVGLHDTAAIARMEKLYLEMVRGNIGLARTLGREIYGREIPQVLLIHVGAMSAHMMPKVIAEYRKAGFQFVSLAEAQADPAYAQDNDPRLPPRPQNLAARAAAKGISVPPVADPEPELAAMCPGAPTASIP